MLFHQLILLSFVIWLCLESSHQKEEDTSDSRQLTSDDKSTNNPWTEKLDDDEYSKSTAESDDRSSMSEIAQNIQEEEDTRDSRQLTSADKK